MSEAPGPAQPRLPSGGAGTRQSLPRAVGSSLAALARDWLLTIALICSALLAVLGVLDGSPPWLWLAPLAGIAGTGITLAAMRPRRAPTAAGTTGTRHPGTGVHLRPVVAGGAVTAVAVALLIVMLT